MKRGLNRQASDRDKMDRHGLVTPEVDIRSAMRSSAKR
jgi:hypothetical protein